MKKELLFNAITEDVKFGISFEQMEVIRDVAFANGITRDDIVKAWSEEPHPTEAGLTFAEYEDQRQKYSAITATFDYYRNKAGMAV